MALQVGELYASFGIDTSGVDKALANIESKFSNLGKSLAVSGAAITAAITVPLVKAGKDIFQTGSDFGKNMSRVFATAGMDKALAADAEAMEALQAKAIEMGSTTKFTSSEAAQAMNYMAMAGWKAEQMLAGIAPIMNVAAAAGEDLATVSDIVTDAMTAFGVAITEDNVAGFGDVLAKTAANANTNVAMLGESFKYVAPLAGTMGYSVEDIAVALGLMANSGIKASQAGTTLRSTISRMASPTKQSREAMEKLGLSLTDKNGQMKSFGQLMKELRQSMSAYSKEEQAALASQLAGKNAMSGLLAIVNATEEEFNKLTEAIDNSAGAAENMAKTALDNAAGDITYFTSAVDGAKIKLWELAEAPFRKIVQQATGYVNAFNNMDEATKKGVLRTAAFTALLGPGTAALGGFVAMLPKMAKGLKLLYSPLGIVSVGLLALGAAALDTDNSIGKTMESISKSIGDNMGKAADYVAQNTAELAKNAGRFLDSFIKSINNALPNVLQAGSDVLAALLDGISLNVDKIIGVATSIVTSIKNNVVANADRIIPAAVQLMRNLLVGMINAIPTLIGNIGEMAIAIGDKLVNEDWSGTASGIWTALTTAFESTKAVLGNLGGIIKEKFGVDSWTDVAVKIWLGLWKGVKNLSGWAAATAMEMLKGLSGSDVWTSKAGFFTTIASAIVDSIGAEIPKLFEHVDGIVNAGVELGNKILEGINSAIAGMKDADLGAKLGNVLGQIIKGIFGSGESLLGNDNINTFMTNLGTAIIGSVDLIGDFAGALLGQLADPTMWAGAGTAVSKVVGQLVTKLGEAIPKALDTAGNVINGGLELAKSLVNGIATGFKEFSADLNIGGIVTSLVDNITKIFDNGLALGTDIINVGADIALSLVNSIANALAAPETDSLVKSAGGLVTSLADKLASWSGWSTAATKFGATAGKLVTAIAKAIPNAIDGAGNLLNAGITLAGSIVDTIVSGFDSFIGSADSNVSAIVSSLVNNIVDVLPKAFALGEKVLSAGAHIAGKIFESIIDALKDVSASGIGETLGTATTDILKNLLGNIGGLSQNGEIITFIQNIGQAIMDGMGALGEIVGGFVGKLMAYLFSEQGLKDLYNAGVTIVELIIGGMGEGMAGLLSFFGNMVDNILIELGIIDPEARDKSRESGRQLAAAMANGMETELAHSMQGKSLLSMMEYALVKGNQGTQYAGSSALSNQMLMGFNAAFDTAAEEAGDDAEKFRNIVFEKLLAEKSLDADFWKSLGIGIGIEDTDAFWDAVDNALSDYDNAVDYLKKNINMSDMIPEDLDFWGAFLDAYKNSDYDALMDLMTQQAVAVFGEVEASVKNAADGANAAAQKALDELGITTQEAANNIESPEFAEKTAGAAKQATDSMTKTLQDGKNTVAAAAQEIPDEVVQRFLLTMSEENGALIANTFLGAMHAAFASAQETLSTLALNIATSAKSALETVLTYASGYKIGGDFASGMAGGIMGSISLVSRAARMIGEKAASALKAAIDSHSPSKITEMIGKWFGEGYAKGIEDKFSRVENAVSTMGRKSTNALEKAGYGTDVHARDVSTGNWWAQVPNTINNTVKKVTDALSKSTKATNNLANTVSEEASYTPRSSTGSDYSSGGGAASAADSSLAAASKSSGGSGISASDLGALVETYARLVATALNGTKVEMDGQEVGSLVAPVVSTIIAQNALARSNGTV